MVVFLPRSHWPPWGGIGRYVLHHVPFLFWFTNGNSTRKKNEVPNDESVQMSWRRRRPRRRRRRVCFHSRPSTRATSFNRRVAMATLTFFQRKRNHNITNCHCLGPFVRTVAGFVFVICCCCCCLNWKWRKGFVLFRWRIGRPLAATWNESIGALSWRRRSIVVSRAGIPRLWCEVFLFLIEPVIRWKLFSLLKRNGTWWLMKSRVESKNGQSKIDFHW